MTEPVLVVGSGMSGAAVAGALLRRGVPTLIAEAGPDAGRQHVAMNPVTADWMAPTADPYFRPVAEGRPGPGTPLGIRARVGGRSLYWRGITLRLEDHALARWPRTIVDSLVDPRGGPGSYAHMEKTLRSWVGHPLDQIRNATEEEWLERVRGAGFPVAMPTPRAIRELGEGRWTAYSPIDTVPTEGVLLTEHRVDSLTPQEGGVMVTMAGPQGPKRLRAPVVVLCGGAVENARLVSRLTGGVTAFPLVDHHAQGWLYVEDPASVAETPQEASLLLACEPARRINRFLEVHEVQGVAVVDAWCMGEQLPSASGSRVEITGEDADELSIHCRLTSDDHDVLAFQREALRDLADRLGFELRMHEGVDDALGFDEALKRAMAEPGRAVAYREPLGAIDHDACTLPLGGPQVDPTGALRELPAVFVAGPSLFPRAGAANPTLTTLALGELLAKQIAERTG